MTIIRVSFNKHAVSIQTVAQKYMTKTLAVTVDILKRILTDMERTVTVSLTYQQNTHIQCNTIQYNTILAFFSTLSYMFLRLMRHLQGKVHLLLKILPEGGTISAETCRRVLIIIRVIYCIVCVHFLVY